MKQPQRGEQEHRAEFHALGKRARDKGRRDDREHELVDHVGLLRNGCGIVGVRRAADVVQEQIAQIADERQAFPERQAVTAIAHRTLTTAIKMKLCIMVLSTFLRRTNPP